MEIPIDYHILFMIMVFILFILTMILLFVETSFQKAVAAFIFAMFNFVLCMLCAYSFLAIDLYGYDTTGALVHNVYSELYPLGFIYVVLVYINLMLMVYATYLFIKKPWEDYLHGKEETDFVYTEW